MLSHGYCWFEETNIIVPQHVDVHIILNSRHEGCIGSFRRLSQIKLYTWHWNINKTIHALNVRILAVSISAVYLGTFKHKWYHRGFFKTLFIWRHCLCCWMISTPLILFYLLVLLDRVRYITGKGMWSLNV